MTIVTWLTAAGMGIASILHLWIIPEHWPHAPAHGIIFLLLGMTQFVWVVFFLRNNSSRVQTTGIILAAGSIFLWSLTRIFPAPFEEGPEALSISGVIVKLSELSSIAGLVRIRLHFLNSKIKVLRSTGIQIILAFLIALAVYFIGKAVEPVLPVLQGKSHNHHDMNVEHFYKHHPRLK